MRYGYQGNGSGDNSNLTQLAAPPTHAPETERIANAAALYDSRKYDGYITRLMPAEARGQTYAKRGWNQIALAGSKDLIHWPVAGK